MRERSSSLLPVEQDRPCVGPRDAHDHAQRRGLARAVGPEEAEDLAGPHVEVEAAYGGDVPEALRDPLDGEKRRAVHGGRLHPCEGSAETKHCLQARLQRVLRPWPEGVQVLERLRRERGVVPPKWYF